MKINKKISAYNNSSRYGVKPKYIVIHWVGAASSARNNATYFAGGNRNASAHYFVDDTQIWQSVNLSRSAWHCGGGIQGSGGHKYYKICTNSNSIGIEMCCKKVNGSLTVTTKTQKLTGELVRYLMKKYGIPASRVIRHYDVTGKSCPAPFLSATKWNKLHTLLTTGAVVNPPKTSTKVTVPTKTLIRGMTGTQVKNLQRCLNKVMKSGLVVDGSYGPAVQKAVKAFQKKYGLAVDGHFGPKSRAKMKKLV